MNNTIKNEEMVNNSNQPHGIKTPTSVEEFRNNLRKYFFCVGDELYLQNGKSPKISEINSLTEFHDFCEETPRISVKVNPLKDFREFMFETKQIFTMDGYFEDENNYEIIESETDFMMDYNPVWIGIDNKLYREFFYLTLGEFSGYSIINK